MAMDPKLVDKRVVARNLDRGTLEKKSYNEWLSALPDLSAQVIRGGEERERRVESAVSAPAATPAAAAPAPASAPAAPAPAAWEPFSAPE